MVQTTNHISLYRKIDNLLVEEAGISVEQLQCGYRSQDSYKHFELKDFEGVLKVNDYDIEWSPSEHNLNIKLEFIINNPSKLFGMNGVTSSGNFIGIAAHIHSKTSGFQQKIRIGIVDDSVNPVRILFNHDFPVGSLRGKVNINFFMYLDKVVNPVNNTQANKKGMVLTENDLYELEIYVDGDGSAFPIGEFTDTDGPLWDINRNWQEASVDSFDANNVLLRFNLAHPLFAQVKGGKTSASRGLMSEIMIQAIGMIINEVILVDGCNINDTEGVASDTILMAVKYWVETFEVDTSSFFSIMNTLRTSLDSTLSGGDINDKLE